MRHNWLECTSASGGTGDLSLIASGNGFPLLSAWVSGIRQVRYTILEYNSNPSSTNATLLRAEDGYCPLDASGPTLKRSDTTTVVLASWNGTNLYPQMGSGTAPSKQSFSTNSGNIRIICSAASEDNPFLTPVISSTIGSATNYGRAPITAGNTSATRITSIQNAGTIYYFPFAWADFGLYTTISLIAGINSGTLNGFYAAIYEVSKTGAPGRQLANFGNLGAPAGSVLTSAALATPVFLDPGWYWLATLPTTASSGAAFVTALVALTGGPAGATFAGGFPDTVQFTAAGSPPLADPAVAPTAAVANFTIPAFGLQ